MLPPEIHAELSICPALVAMLENAEVSARDGRTLELHSASTPNNLFALKRLFEKTQARATLETGLGYGASCALLSACHKASGAAPAQQHVAVDPFQTTDWNDAAEVLLEQAGLIGYAEIVQKPSRLHLPALCAEGRVFDLVYVDGSHLFEDVFMDFFHARFLLRKGGVIAFDDCPIPHVAKVLRFITTNLRGQFRELDLSSFRADGGRTLKYRAVRMLGKVQLRAFEKIGESERPIHSTLIDF